MIYGKTKYEDISYQKNSGDILNIPVNITFKSFYNYKSNSELMCNYFWLAFCVLQDGHWFWVWHSMTHNCGPEHTSQIVAVHLCVGALGHSENNSS